MGIEVVVDGLSKSFGGQNIWQNVTLTLPAGEISVLLGPSGTGKTVFLKSLIGLIKPEKGRVLVDGVDMVNDSDRKVFEARKLFGLMFQDGALFGSLSLYDNIAFPLREHTKKKEPQIRRIVLERMDMVGLAGQEGKLPGQISGGMRKRAGLARALVLDPQIILCDEPDSGLDPVRTAFLSQLLIDVNARIDATMVIVTHNIEIASTVPDNIGMLFRRDLVTFGPREALLTSDEPVIAQFLRGNRHGPIGMAEEKDAATLAAEQSSVAAVTQTLEVPPQLQPSPGLPPRPALLRRTGGIVPPQPPPAEPELPEPAARQTPDFVAPTRILERRPPAATLEPAALVIPGAGALRQTGRLFQLAATVLSMMWRRPFQARELIQQFWFIASVTILPTALVSIPFGAVIALQVGSLATQLGAQSFTGGASVLAIVRQGSPLIVALLISGAAGSAICADLGARTIREETDAMEVMGISPIQRLVVPRVLACMLVAVALNGLVSVVGVAGGYFFNVALQGGTPGAYLASFSALAQLPDLYVGELNALIFGFIAGVVAAYRGLNPGAGPKGVGDAVNQSVVITFLLLFAVNLVITGIYLQVVPPKGA